jgi:hypothetical protein
MLSSCKGTTRHYWLTQSSALHAPKGVWIYALVRWSRAGFPSRMTLAQKGGRPITEDTTSGAAPTSPPELRPRSGFAVNATKGA